MSVRARLLDEKILAASTALDAAGIPHAFGGALALAYYAAPRATIDIDLNVFVPAAQATRVFSALEPLGVSPAAGREREQLRDRGQVRLFWEHTPLDLFFAYDPLHESAAARLRRVPFGEGAAIPILACEDLAILKAIFDREKDWRDLREMLFSLGGEFDGEYALDWLRRILSANDKRLRRFETLLREPDAGT